MWLYFVLKSNVSRKSVIGAELPQRHFLRGLSEMSDNDIPPIRWYDIPDLLSDARAYWQHGQFSGSDPLHSVCSVAGVSAAPDTFREANARCRGLDEECERCRKETDEIIARRRARMSTDQSNDMKKQANALRIELDILQRLCGAALPTNDFSDEFARLDEFIREGHSRIQELEERAAGLANGLIRAAPL
jgi:hypothetical protein